MTFSYVRELAVLFTWSFLAATIIPLGSEPVLAFIVSRNDPFVLPVAIATAGNYLGACTTYWLAMTAAHRVASNATAARAAASIRKYGAPALLLSWVPILGDAIVAAAGVARLPFGRFSIYTVIGKAARYLAIAAAVRGLM